MLELGRWWDIEDDVKYESLRDCKIVVHVMAIVKDNKGMKGSFTNTC